MQGAAFGEDVLGSALAGVSGQKLGQGWRLGWGGTWRRGLGTDWRGRRLRARRSMVPPTAIYTGAPVCFLLEMSPPIPSLMPDLPHPSFLSVPCGGAGTTSRLGWLEQQGKDLHIFCAAPRCGQSQR